MQKKWIMHVDMDAFYASIEQRDHPEWRGKPVVVGGTSERGVVATASYEARRLGVHSAMPTKRAAVLCPEAVFVRPRIDWYQQVSAQIHDVLYRYAPDIEPLSLDEAFLDVSGMGMQYPHLGALGRAVKDDIRRTVGLTASVGIAPNKFLAKLASDWHKPDGLTIIPYGQEKKLIAPLPIERLWGVGQKTAQRLRDAGYDTIGDIARSEKERLQKLLGQVGRQLHDLANGIDHRPLNIHAERKSYGEEETYDTDIHDDVTALGYLARYCDLIAQRLRQKGVRARTVTLKVRFASFRTLTRSKTVSDPMDLQQELYFHVQSLYNKVVKQEGIRLLGVTASGIVPAHQEMSLFPDEHDRQRKAAAVMDSLREKYGKDVLRQGFWWDEISQKEGIDDDGK